MRCVLMAFAIFLVGATHCSIHAPWGTPDIHVPWHNRLTSEFGSLSTENAFSYVTVYTDNLWPSCAHYSDLGNAHFLADQLPEAILAYQRGLRLDPNDQGLRENLDYARSRVQSPFGERGRPEEDAWPAWLYQPSAFQVLLAAFLIYGMAWMLLTRWWMTRRRALLVRGLLLTALAAVVGGYWLHLENDCQWREEHPLVVVRQERTPLRKGNGPSYPVNPELPFLSRGMEARRLYERGEWLQIRFASGAVGWVEKGAVLVDKSGHFIWGKKNESADRASLADTERVS